MNRTTLSLIAGATALAATHSSDATMCTTRPIITGARRPNRSDSGPMTNCPIAPPMSVAVIVSWALPSLVPRSRATSGSDGR